ncbi:MAG TPA: ATP-dependent helicase HrpB [Microthrixaceae bacterium]|nr:ATP-dependent helicase HrpB [Microthrixaceae bacterium]
MTGPLPVYEVLDQLRAALHSPGAAVLIAPPGTGKTTGVPPELIDSPWLGGQKILVLEPRRLAARVAASRMAATHGESVGGVFGYSVRGSSKRSGRTRVEVVTEGLFIRRLQNDPSLEGVGAVLLDEFHERSLDSDLALALLLDSRAALRPDLRILVMSATLDAEPVAELIRGPVIRAESPMFPVETRYRPASIHVPLNERVRDVIVESLRNDRGDVLVFLPGKPEIGRTRRALSDGSMAKFDDVQVVELHGSLSVEDQELAISSDPEGRRRVVLSTSLAETSITVEGVRVVIDAGRRRSVSVDSNSGLPGLVTGPVSRAGADQRRGRAGRTAPGVAYRLWSENDNRHRPAADRPEILRSDLAALVLQLRSWGVGDPGDLAWLDPPPAAALERAGELLELLGAIDSAGHLTPRGRRLSEIGFHPRLASVIAEGVDCSSGELAAELAAILETARSGEIDLLERVRLLRDDSRARRLHGDLRQALRQWRAAVPSSAAASTADARAKDTSASDLEIDIARLMLAGFPDRVARRRDVDRVDERGRSKAVFHLRSGGEVLIPDGHELEKSRWIVAADLDASSGALHLGTAIPDDLVRSLVAKGFQTEETVEWNRQERSIESTVRTRLGQITFDTRPLKNPSPEKLRYALLAALADVGPQVLGRLGEADRLRARVALVRQSGDSDNWPDFSDEGLAAHLPDWLGDRISRIRTAKDLDRIDVRAALIEQLDWSCRSRLDDLTPSDWVLSNGRRVKLRYGEVDGDPATVLASVRLREAFGTDVHPTVAGTRIPVVVELLSPAGRPVQRTTDLPGFWRGSYSAVRSDLRGRYPKHPWPEEPWKPLPPRR